MTNDLDHILNDFISDIPSDENIIFFSDNLISLPDHLFTDKMYIKKVKQAYDSYYRADALWFYAYRNIYRKLGLLILSVIFNEKQARLSLHLTHELSQIKRIIIEFDHKTLSEVLPGYTTRPYAFNYAPQTIQKYPWRTQNIEPSDLPCFLLTNSEQNVITDQDWESRDTILGFGTDVASVRFAELLLNLSSPQNTNDEYVLEGEGAYRGVGIHSAEARLFLPGHLAWEYEAWQ